MPVRFLIADDYSAHQKLMANIISSLGGVMRCAGNGYEAVRLARTEDFDVVLMDLHMPGLGGIAAADRLLDTWGARLHRPRIVAVTGENTPERRALCHAVGMDGFIAKPCDASTLRGALQRVIMSGHCWIDAVPERTLDLKRFLEAATDLDFAGWANSAPEALRAAAGDAAQLEKFQQQARGFGFLALERLLQSRADSATALPAGAALAELRRCRDAGHEALCMTRDQMLEAA